MDDVPREESFRSLSMISIAGRPSFVRPATLLVLLLLGGLAIAPLAAAQTVSLPFSATVKIASAVDSATFVLDLGTLPPRAELVVTGVAPSSPSAEVRIETTNRRISDEIGNCSAVELASSRGTGAKEIVAPFHRFCYSGADFFCEPSCTDFVGDTLDLQVSVPVADRTAYPIVVDLVVAATTVVPSGTLLVDVPSSAQQTRTFVASKDTVLYERNPGNSNGAGADLVVGISVTATTDDIRALLAFDVAGPELGRVPLGAVVDDVEMEIDVRSFGGTGIALRRVAPDAGLAGASWPEGDADDFLENGRVGSISTTPAATWSDRDSGGIPWSVPGGDPETRVLAAIGASRLTLGSNLLSSSALADAVADMVATGQDEDGFVLSPLGARLPFSTRTRIRSREVPGLEPRLHVTYTAVETDSTVSESIDTDVRSFIGEGEDFRWIYDEDGDQVVFTDIGGVCTVANEVLVDSVPWTYGYTGDPGFTGVDCCLWQIESPETGTTGAGQAIFFHNLDASDPANLPPDSDADGIRDVCDNCPATPNGPLLGTCLSGASLGAPCRSDAECGGQACSLAQEDLDLDGFGQACPEPGFAVGLGIAWVALVRAGGRPPREGRSAVS